MTKPTFILDTDDDKSILRLLAVIEEREAEPDWNPLVNDAQAMELLKKWLGRIEIGRNRNGNYWTDVYDSEGRYLHCMTNESLNRAICLAIIESSKMVCFYGKRKQP